MIKALLACAAVVFWCVFLAIIVAGFCDGLTRHNEPQIKQQSVLT
jgi:hypothetical protein